MNLEDLISSLYSNEKSLFRHILQRRTDDSKELELFDYLCQRTDWSPGELCAKMYHPPKPSSYSAVRNRLERKLIALSAYLSVEDSLNQKRIDPLAYRATSSLLLARNKWKAAARYLHEAEESAKHNHEYHTLDLIYTDQLHHADDLDVNLQELEVRKEKNLNHLLDMEKLSKAYARMRLMVNDCRRSGNVHDPKEFVESTMKEFNINRRALKNVAFMLKLTQIYRGAIKSAKEYLAFEPYLIKVYHQLDGLGSFPDAHMDYRIHFMYLIAHTKYRNLRFDESRNYIQKILDLISRDRSRQHPMYVRLVTMLAAIDAYQGNNTAAIDTIEKEIRNNKLNINDSDRYDILLNQIVCYFNAGEFKTANKLMLQMIHCITKIEDTKGREFRCKVEMVEVLIQYESGKIEIARSHIQSMMRRYSTFFENETYQFVHQFLRLVKKLIDFPEEKHSEDFADDVFKLSNNWPAERRDIQAIAFFCWLKSKVQRRDYYHVLVDWMRKEAQRQEEVILFTGASKAS